MGYFFIVFGLIMWNVFFGLFAPPIYSPIPQHWSTVILTICANRLVVNLRRASNLSNQSQTTDIAAGTGYSWSVQNGAIGDTPVPASYPGGGRKSTAVGAVYLDNVIEMAPRRELDTVTTASGYGKYPSRMWGGNPYV